MRPFEILDTNALIDALAEYTAKYTKILSEGGNKKDMVNCQETIESLITEIEVRKRFEKSEPSAGTERH
jgi:hypothetical protein